PAANLAAITREEKLLVRIFVRQLGEAGNMRFREGPLLFATGAQALVEGFNQRLQILSVRPDLHGRFFLRGQPANSAPRFDPYVAWLVHPTNFALYPLFAKHQISIAPADKNIRQPLVVGATWVVPAIVAAPALSPHCCRRDDDLGNIEKVAMF